MGQITPNIGIYIMAAGETNYENSFAQGMINVDQHDHSGGPNKGVPISTTGLSPNSVTYDKLNSNVVDPTTGIGVSGSLPNQLQILGLLKNIYQLAAVSGFITKDGILAHARTFQNTATTTWTNPDGVGGDPHVDVNIAGISPVVVANGGTGLTSLNPWDILLGGTTSTGTVQQVSGEGTALQYLGSNGAAAIPSWKTLPVATQDLLQATISLTAAQFDALSGTPIQIIAAPGAGKVIIPYNAYAKLIYGSVDRFHAGSSVRFYWGAAATTDANCFFNTSTFLDTFSCYYIAVAFEPSSSTGIPIANMENQPLVISVNSANFTGGSGNVVTMSIQYSIISI